MWVTTEQEAYTRMVRGECVSGRRGIGKTTALCRVIQDLHDGDAVVFCTGRDHAEYVKGLWKAMYPGHRIPVFVWENLPRGFNPKAVYADNWESFSERDKDEIGPFLRAAVL